MSPIATSSENKVPFHQQEMSILKELVRSGSMADTHTDSMLMSSVHHAEPEYNCINREPTSIINSEHLNHHHHHLMYVLVWLSFFFFLSLLSTLFMLICFYYIITVSYTLVDTIGPMRPGFY